MKTLIFILVTVALTAMADGPVESRDWFGFIQSAYSNRQMQSRAQEAIVALRGRALDLVTSNQEHLDDKAYKLLVEEHELWEQWARARAELISDTYRGGSHQALALQYEMIHLYLARIKQLKQLPEDLKP